MSKSLGNVLDPYEVIDNFGADALRYYCFREVSFGQDGQISPAGFEARYETELANEYGNLASRTLSMIGRYRDGSIPDAEAEPELADGLRRGRRARPRAARRRRAHPGPRGDLEARPPPQPVRRGDPALGPGQGRGTAEGAWTASSTASPRACGSRPCCFCLHAAGQRPAARRARRRERELAEFGSRGGGHRIEQIPPLFPKLEACLRSTVRAGCRGERGSGSEAALAGLVGTGRRAHAVGGAWRPPSRGELGGRAPAPRCGHRREPTSCCPVVPAVRIMSPPESSLRSGRYRCLYRADLLGATARTFAAGTDPGAPSRPQRPGGSSALQPPTRSSRSDIVVTGRRLRRQGGLRGRTPPTRIAASTRRAATRTIDYRAFRSARLPRGGRHPCPPRALRARRGGAGRRGAGRGGPPDPHRRAGRGHQPRRRSSAAEAHEQVFACVGRHPNCADGFDGGGRGDRELAAEPARGRDRRDRARPLPRPRRPRRAAAGVLGPDRDRRRGRAAGRGPPARPGGLDRGDEEAFATLDRRGGGHRRHPPLLLAAPGGSACRRAGLVLLLRRQRHLPEGGAAARGGRGWCPRTGSWSRPTPRSCAPADEGQAEPARQRGRHRRAARRGARSLGYEQLERRSRPTRRGSSAGERRPWPARPPRLGQNFLADPNLLDAIVRDVRASAPATSCSRSAAGGGP